MASDMSCVLGIDVGGTSIKAALMSLSGDIMGMATIPTGAIVGQEAFDQITRRLTDLVRGQERKPSQVVALGLDVPGPVDDAGNVGFFPNIKMDAQGLLATLRQAFPDAAIAFVNDANAAALGELWKGSARGAKSFVMVTLGTGVGGGIVQDGKLVAGAFGSGGELGHLTVRPEGEERTCGCGRHGCLEQYASATGLVWMYRQECRRRGVPGVQLRHDTDTLTLFEAYQDGDKCARVAVAQMCECLGFALAQVSAVIDPESYLIGGGVAGAFDLFSDQLVAAYHRHCLPNSKGTKILPCSLGNAAGTYGAAFAGLQKAGLV